MSVLVSDRTESKFEAITYSIELHDMLIDFMQHGFGVKSVDDYVRLRYAYGKDDRENFSKYRFMMQNFKNRVDQNKAIRGYLRDFIIEDMEFILFYNNGDTSKDKFWYWKGLGFD